MDILFKDKNHENFFFRKYKELNVSSDNRDMVAFLYLIGMYESSRTIFGKLFDPETRTVLPEGLADPSLTDSSLSAVMLAFNLYTWSSSFVEEIGINMTDLSVANIFRRNDCTYYVQALKLWNPYGFDR